MTAIALTFHDITSFKNAARVKNEFISIASHQLRTPLTAVKLYSEMLGQNFDNNQAQETDYLEKIKLSTERMIRLVNDLLQVSRLESGKMVLDPEPANIENELKESIEEVALIAKENSCMIHLQSENKFPLVTIDTHLFKQVIHSLLINAIKYRGDKKCLIKLDLKKISSQDFQVSVSDNGIGISKKAEDRIFDKFFRSSKAMKRETDGSGLGLYVSKRIVEACGGKIWFETEEGKGTTFFLELPLVGKEGAEYDDVLI